MAYAGILEVFIAFFVFIFFHFLIHKKPHQILPRNWPVLGMLPGVLAMLHRINDYVAEILELSNLTFVFKGPWFSGMNMLITADPANIQHVFSSNFTNYDKGPEFKEMFDFLGNGIFTADSKLWENMRKSALVVLSHQGFQSFSLRTITRKIENGVVPVLDHFAEANMIFDLQDVFQRLAFDVTLTLVAGYDSNSLSIEMPMNEYAKAMDDAEEVVVYRHVKPMILWKLQNWIGVGEEKKMTKANAAFDRSCAKYISAKREEIISRRRSNIGEEAHDMDLLSVYMNLDASKYELLKPTDDNFLKDIIKSFMLAGRDAIATTLTWFFWLLSKNPEAVTKIRQEINNTNLPSSGMSLDADKLNKMVYLHAALCESLRLYAPIPFERKSPIKQDVLPSGHKVDANWKILFSVYALGRMKAVWGEDATEFKPERWISERNGGLKHEPSFKFFVFNSGPRNCLGKNLSFLQMKKVAVEIIRTYDIIVVEGHKIEPASSIVLHMKHGLIVTVAKICLVS
ncbi:PREDICTED: alkane hydroxylase MAH1-like [Camelina sativa]|uniref:Alkane hydroxylase MAH1-like n=1 Tax=Camelina sativa TaxID=90675 RepID=A0ABM0WNP5_CAMSA|nr:PREDICTED: alkane hydroxylase MAH1-like [Camelina sativa]